MRGDAFKMLVLKVATYLGLLAKARMDFSLPLRPDPIKRAPNFLHRGCWRLLSH
jgi:hypothetical protein